VTISKDDPVLQALEEGFADLGIETGPESRPRKETNPMLPTEKTPARMSLSELTVLVHGPAKIGKSDMCSHAEKAIFLATEAGLNALEVYQVPITTWSEFLAACGEIREGKHEFKTVVVDTLDNLFLMCMEHVCARLKIEHPADLGYGKGFSLVNGEFYRALNKLSLLPYGLFLISHSQQKEIETRTGKRTRIVPTLPDKARRMVLGMVDVILYCDVDTVASLDGKAATERRVMRTKPTEAYEAGDRTGRLPAVIELDYAKFAEAFERATPSSESPASTKPAVTPVASSGAPTEKPSENSPAPEAAKQYATAAQVLEFLKLAEALAIPDATLRQRLADFGAAEPDGLTRDDMETILSKLRAANGANVVSGEHAA